MHNFKLQRLVIQTKYRVQTSCKNRTMHCLHIIIGVKRFSFFPFLEKQESRVKSDEILTNPTDFDQIR